MAIGAVSTGEPGTPASVVNVGTASNAVLSFTIPRGATGVTGADAEVTNSGTAEDAVFDFVIPRGETGSAGTPDVLAAVDNTAQTTNASGALVFNDNPLVSGTSITHTPGSSDIGINQNGIYLPLVHAAISPSAGTTIPATLTLALEQGGAPIVGGTAAHDFTSSTELANISFGAPFQATAAPTNLRVVADQAGFTINDISLTVIRLGD